MFCFSLLIFNQTILLRIFSALRICKIFQKNEKLKSYDDLKKKFPECLHYFGREKSSFVAAVV